MSITSITIQNFKGIREPIRIEIKPITLLFGANSAGKSTIVQALHYAREIFERHNLNPDRTLLGGESIDLGGFENLVHQHNKLWPMTMAFELDLSREDLPTYTDGEVRYIGTDMLDNAGSSYLLDALSRISKASVGITIRWSELTASPYAAVYRVSVNDSELVTVEASADGQQIYISRINPYNEIFLDEGVTPEDARKNAAKFFTETNDFFSPESGDFWGDLALSDVGAMLTPLFQYMNFENGIPGLSKPINLTRQHSAIPRWEKNLSLDSSIWAEDIEFEDRPNFTRLLSSLIVGPGELVRDGLRKLCYVGPLRNVPGRNHKPATSPDNSRWSNGLAAYDTLFFSDEAFVDQVNEWLADEGRLNSGYSVKVKKYRELENDHPLMLAILQGRTLDEDKELRNQLLALPVLQRLLIRDEARDIELAPQDIGVGISQVLPVVVAALHHKTGIVAIEQPELHIHPAFQVALGDLFIEQIRQRSDLTFILETHSEHLMLRFLRRIRETGENEAPENRTLLPAELSIYFIEQGDSGISCLPIRVDKDGDFIDRWPRGFFTERAGELF